MAMRVNILYLHLLWGDALHVMVEQFEHYFIPEVLPLNQESVQRLAEPSIVILEILYPDQEVLKMIRMLKRADHKILLIGFMRDHGLLSEVLDAGIDGYLLKTCGREQLRMALRQLAEGAKYFCSAITEILSRQVHDNRGHHKSRLSEREYQILLLLVELKSPFQIAQSLNISESTVRTHRKNIMRKVGAKNMLGLLKFACSKGLLCRDERVLCF